MATITKQEELLQELLKEYEDTAEALKPGGLVNELKKRLIEQAMCAELDNHLGYAKHKKREQIAGILAMQLARKPLLAIPVK